MPANDTSREAAQLTITRRQSEHDHLVIPQVIKLIDKDPWLDMKGVCHRLYLDDIPTPRNFGKTDDMIDPGSTTWHEKTLRRILTRNGIERRRGYRGWKISPEARDRFIA